MPTYNCAKYLQYSISSILKQEFKEYEFLIIDDGSSDNTEEVIADFSDNRIKYVKLPHQGKPAIINWGIENSKYDLIFHMDSDDIAHPQLLREQVALHSNSPNNSWIGCNYAVFTENSYTISYLVQNPIDHETILKGMCLHGTTNHAGSIVRKDVVKKIGGYKNLDVLEDFEFWLRGKEKIYFRNNPKVLYFVRNRRNSISRINTISKNYLHYKILQPYYDNLSLEFRIQSFIEEQKFRGWREYHYGYPKEARKHWKRMGFEILRNYRILLAFIVSYLPQNLFAKFKESRFRFRMGYILRYFSKKNREIRKQLKKLII